MSTQLNKSSSLADNQILNELVFVRRRFEPITAKNIEKCLDIHTLQGSALESLQSVLHSIWCPTLLENKAWNEKLPPKVTQLLSELESTLNANVLRDTRDDRSNRNGGKDNASPQDVLENITDIYEPMDEINFWRKAKDSRDSKTPKLLAHIVDQELSKLAHPGFDDLINLEFNQINDFISRIFDCLNTIWLTPASETDDKLYPQKRMEHFFSCIGSALCRYIQNKLQNLNIWSNVTTNNTTTENCSYGGNDNHITNTELNRGEVRLQLTNAVAIMSQWCEVPRQLTRSYWAGSSNNKQRNNVWKGDPYNDTFASAFQQRLEQVISILSTSQELTQLLTTDERRAFPLEKIYKPLENTHPLLYNPYTQPQWLKSVAEFDKSLAPIESAVVTRFKNNLTSIMNQPAMVIIEFQKYRSLINRPTIRTLLLTERDSLLAMLRDYVKRIEGAIDKIEYEAESGKMEKDVFLGVLSPKVRHIVQLRQLYAKLTGIKSTAVNLLNDIDGFDRFKMSCDNTLQRLKSEESNRYQSWLSDVQQRIEDDDPNLSLQGSLMSWKDGILTVNYSTELVTYSREVHQLLELGFDIPKGKGGSSGKRGKQMGIIEKAQEAEKYYRYGVLLKKTANFYNSISEQMIDVQEQLLLDSLTAFANIVSKQGMYMCMCLC